MQSNAPSNDAKFQQALLFLLCSKVTGLREDLVTPYYKNSLKTLGSNISTPSLSDEFELVEKIKRKLVRQRREKDAAVFSELHRKLQSQRLLQDRWAILYALYRLQGSNIKPTTFSEGLTSNLISTPYDTLLVPPSITNAIPQLHLTVSSGASSGVSSYCTNESSSLTPQSLLTNIKTPAALQRLQPTKDRTMNSLVLTSLINSVDQATLNHRSTGSRSRAMTDISSIRSVAPLLSSSLNQHPENTSYEIPESLMLKEIISAFQGIDGNYLKYDPSKEVFNIDFKIGITNSTRQMVSKMAECGFLYKKIQKYADSRSTDRAFGLVGQSFCAALHQELTEYYRLIAVLEAQLQQEEDHGLEMITNGLTLRRLMIWMFDPMLRLKTLASLVDICQGKKGGSLASAIHSYTQHGDPSVRTLVKHTLTVVAQPIFTTIIHWIYDGELEDIYHEFFVASDPTVKDDRLWHDKYSLRKSMIPSFLNQDQAKKILLTGKAINFLRQVCQDRTIIRNRHVIKAAETNEVDSIFTQDLDGIFQNMIDTVYKETSMHLLQVLHTKYKFMDHLKAMRRYLLLGQGDFIRHLMDLLEEDLAKPAQTLFLHNLTGILETAVRATNAQYDDTDILKRLDVRLLEVSAGDTGWDVFSLEYHVSGHIRTVFTPECMIMYLRVFNFLWRAKRMEYILAIIWKEQMAHAKLLRSFPEMALVLHQCHLICSEMLHFVQQVQYYINFEVLECSWDELLKKVKDAEDLDQIIAAHQEFLDAITTRSLLHQESKDILTQLRTIFDLIIQFQDIQNGIYESVKTEILMRQKFEDLKNAKTEKGEWALTEDEEETEKVKRLEFTQSVIPITRSKLRVLVQSYQKMVEQFLVMLTSHSDVSLRFLSFRLNFNEHYHTKASKISPSPPKTTKKKI